MSETLDAIGDRISPERMYERRKAAVSQRLHRMRDAVMGSPDYEEPVTQRARERASQLTHEAKDRMEQTQHAAAATVRGNPLAAGAVALGAGMLLATAMPRSRTEQRLAQQTRPQLDHAREELVRAGRDLVDDAKEHARDAGQHVVETSRQAAQHVADEARGD
jgi:hypothetical protein